MPWKLSRSLASDQGELLLKSVARAAGDRESLLPFVKSLADSLLAGCVFFAAEFLDESLG